MPKPSKIGTGSARISLNRTPKLRIEKANNAGAEKRKVIESDRQIEELNRKTIDLIKERQPFTIALTIARSKNDFDKVNQIIANRKYKRILKLINRNNTLIIDRERKLSELRRPLGEDVKRIGSFKEKRRAFQLDVISTELEVDRLTVLRDKYKGRGNKEEEVKTNNLIESKSKFIGIRKEEIDTINEWIRELSEKTGEPV
jgi:hypothetical protein